ncbi:SchA/CurD-like domain-containing protein [Yinghuangia sp. YIM S09857]|uniref:SchA/CurD-like domain-containing protein n=1 Tax=Yinghuangia sp. YIM S09857 TaxID=3436929 RepID=UPI003F538054
MDTTVRSQVDRDDVARAGADGAKLRVLLMLEIHEGSQDRFLDAYESIRDQVARVPGHLRDQLCQSIEDPTQWLITSEWAGADEFLAWVDSPEHQMMVRPLHGCVRGTRSLRYAVARETDKNHPDAHPTRTAGRRAAAPEARPAAPRPAADGVIRCALSFPVMPGSEDEVAHILSAYDPPDPRVDDTTSLRRTSVFMRGPVVVRAIEITGDMGAAMAHVARQPQVRRVEEALNPHLVEPRNLDDPQAAREFFMRAALAEAFQRTSVRPRPDDERATRHAYLYPVRHGSAEAAARLLAEHDEAVLADPDGPLAATSVYVRQDLLVRVVDLRPGHDDDLAARLGVDPRTAARMAELLDGHDDLADTSGLRRLHEASAMASVTDRRAALTPEVTA